MTNEAEHVISRNAAAIFKARLTRKFSSSAASEPRRRKKSGLLSKKPGGNKRRAAELLGISRAQLYRHLKEQSAE
ncbi:helix-turn-helix domain-containing protein (plasmid) [Sinorhizobium sp. K101]|nr:MULTISPECIES: helix-turn-helix domain-containing protein [unclassified Sinorhizobium]WEJ08655.1 helix-turn-helix domain-containing protein [Sinorhizobium sp. M103]WEJ13845.1 helix-turn-helix domain-containing protein [Sinorhizobium sp. K101]WEJ35440.1 helix-turn-helix domain-containing protein [Sinorhizobium sp. C101]